MAASHINQCSKQGTTRTDHRWQRLFRLELLQQQVKYRSIGAPSHALFSRQSVADHQVPVVQTLCGANERPQRTLHKQRDTPWNHWSHVGLWRRTSGLAGLHRRLDRSASTAFRM